MVSISVVFKVNFPYKRDSLLTAELWSIEADLYMDLVVSLSKSVMEMIAVQAHGQVSLLWLSPRKWLAKASAVQRLSTLRDLE